MRTPALYAALVLVVVVFLVPIVWMLLLAIRPASVAQANPLDPTFSPDWSAFEDVFGSGGVGRDALISSVAQAGLATIIALPLAVLACYGLTRFEYRGREFLSLWYLGLMLAPPVVFVIPLFVVMSQIGVIGGDWGVILAYQTFAIPLAVLLMRSFFEDVPAEIEEAAMLDGCNRWRILTRVLIPMVAPGLVVAGIFVFCFCWNNLIFAMPLTGGVSVPLTVRALSFFATSGISWNYIGATAVVSMIVPMLLFWLFRKHLVAGLTFGAVKG
ncbi:MAG TPA: carbohydrate ABC transporter permease [Mycobacteriales bacterium]|nr:carbohydrate ABC transporter permease [Mycobacteriales bacterium]